ncbi:hypothetical protein ACTXMT_11975 [Psychrobacter faecalis]|uniref:hypothetical protein n=1 Tax=Psychrobacter faecalis TaxID=180588 RepID=UPI003FCFCDB6
MQLSCYERLKSGEELNVEEITALIKSLKKILAKGGVVVVSERDSLITTYNLDSFNRKKQKKGTYNL